MLTDEDKHWITERLEQMQERLKEYTDQRAEVIETRMLRAFRNFAHPVEARLRVNKALTTALDDRLDAMEDRVAALEERRTGQ